MTKEDDMMKAAGALFMAAAFAAFSPLGEPGGLAAFLVGTGGFIAAAAWFYFRK